MTGHIRKQFIFITEAQNAEKRSWIFRKLRAMAIGLIRTVLVDLKRGERIKTTKNMSLQSGFVSGLVFLCVF